MYILVTQQHLCGTSCVRSRWAWGIEGSPPEREEQGQPGEGRLEEGSKNLLVQGWLLRGTGGRRSEDGNNENILGRGACLRRGPEKHLILILSHPSCACWATALSFSGPQFLLFCKQVAEVCTL